MSRHSNLSLAKKNKNDEFYTRYEDIEKEIEYYFEYDNNVFKNKTILLPCDNYIWSNFTKYVINNFGRFGLKKLISTCISEQQIETKNNEINLFTSCEDFEKIENLETRGKLFIKNKDGEIEGYLEGDGSFRSEEITKLRDNSDIIITNPPFSLFRDFVDWLFEGNKQFLIIGNINAISYRDIFSLIRTNKMWLGGRRNGIYETFNEKKERIEKSVAILWFTNLHHHKRNKRLELNTMEENVKITGTYFEKYDNYDAININKTKRIPSDYEGVMGVPITFLEKYNSEQFEILGIMNTGEKNEGIRYKNTPHGRPLVKGKEYYIRILIRHKRA